MVVSVKVGDLVIYNVKMYWGDIVSLDRPMGMVVDQRSADSEYHHRIRVMWMGSDIPINAKAMSTTGERVTSWVSPKHFEVISEIEIQRKRSD